MGTIVFLSSGWEHRICILVILLTYSAVLPEQWLEEAGLEFAYDHRNLIPGGRLVLREHWCPGAGIHWVLRVP